MKALLCALTVALVAGCGTIVDDGRKLDPAYVHQARIMVEATKQVTAAVPDTASLVEKTQCSTVWASPIYLASGRMYMLGDLQVALLRSQGLDEMARVAYAPASFNLPPLAVIESVEGHQYNAFGILGSFNERMADGKPTRIKAVGLPEQLITPVKVCRNSIVFPWPGKNFQDEHYAWEKIMVPGHVFDFEAPDALSADEVLWMAVWTQGLSEEAAGRMRVYLAGMTVLESAGAFMLGVRGGGAAVSAGAKAAAGAVGRAMAVSVAKTTAVFIAADIAAMQVNRWGMDAVAATGFGEADAWAVRGMKLLGRDPHAGLTLHRRLMRQERTANAFALTEDRLTAMLGMLEHEPAAALPVESGAAGATATPVARDGPVETVVIPATSAPVPPAAALEVPAPDAST